MLVACSTFNKVNKDANISHVKKPVSKTALSDYHFMIGEISSLEGNSNQAISHFKLASLYQPQSDIHYRLAEEHLDTGNIKASIESSKKALELNQQATKPLVLLGNLYAIEDNIDKATKAFKRAVTKKEYSALLYLSAIYEKQGNFSNAIEMLKKSLHLSPSTSHIAHYKLGNLYLNQNPLLAKKHYRLAIEENWDFVPPVLSLHDMYKSEGNIEQAVGVLSNFQSISNKTPEVSLRLADLYLAQKRLPDAYNEFSFIYNTMPYDLTVPTKMGLILVEQGKYERAAAIFNQILDQAPDSDSTKFYLAAVYEELDLKQEALDTFLEITKNSSHYEEAMLHAAYLSNFLGKKSSALLIMKETLKSHPSLQVKIMYANLLGEQGKHDEAILILTNALLDFQNNIDLYYAIGSIYDMAGEKNKTIEFMSKVIELDPNNVAALNYIAYTYSEQGLNLDTAQRLAHKALRLNPNDGYIKDTLGWILYKKGRLEDAIVILESAHDLEPNESVIADHLGDVYYKNNQIRKATAMYEKAVELETNAALLDEIKAKLANLKDNEPPTEIPNQTPLQDYEIISAN